jgi:hypothetical protein
MKNRQRHHHSTAKARMEALALSEHRLRLAFFFRRSSFVKPLRSLSMLTRPVVTE